MPKHLTKDNALSCKGPWCIRLQMNQSKDFLIHEYIACVGYFHLGCQSVRVSLLWMQQSKRRILFSDCLHLVYRPTVLAQWYSMIRFSHEASFTSFTSLESLLPSQCLLSFHNSPFPFRPAFALSQDPNLIPSLQDRRRSVSQIGQFHRL